MQGMVRLGGEGWMQGWEHSAGVRRSIFRNAWFSMAPKKIEW
jgi:hypothetical protein